MPPEDLLSYLQAIPFIPFRITLSEGFTFEVHHPDLVLVGKKSAIVGITNDAIPLYDRHVTVALSHIIKIEPLAGITQP